MAKKTPEINATSTADIAFLLLVFFLATTSMNVDSGIFRRLPPYTDSQEAPKINKRNILKVMITRNNELGINDNPADMRDLKERTIEFITNPNNSPNLPQKAVKNIPLLGNVEVSKGIVSLQCDRGTSFETYMAVQNELTTTYQEVRDREAMKRFGKKFNQLKGKAQEAIKDLIPLAISEAEPKNIGGK